MQDMKSCPSCLEQIPIGALKCKHCQSYVGRRRYITFSATLLSLLVALISVTTVMLSSSSVGLKSLGEFFSTYSIEISFKEANGVAPEKTPIMFKGVKIGMVKNVRLSMDRRYTIIDAAVDKAYSNYFNEKTRVWLARQQGVNNMTIEIDPGSGGKRSFSLMGSMVRPIFLSGEIGYSYRLKATQLYSVTMGTPVVYRGIQVGAVDGYTIDEDAETITLNVFIHSPHNRLLRKSSRFWIEGSQKNSYNELNIGSGKAVNATSAIAFDYSYGEDAAEAGDVFRLYPNKKSSLSKTYVQKNHFLLLFTTSVSDLEEGSPVEFLGIQIGQVIDIEIGYDSHEKQFLVKVLIEIEPERVVLFNKSNEKDLPKHEDLIASGLRARLKYSSKNEGKAFIELFFSDEKNNVSKIFRYDRPIIPVYAERDKHQH